MSPMLHGHVNQLYRAALKDVLTHGEAVQPRSQATQELQVYSTGLLDCRQNLLVSPARGLNYQFMVAEWAWIMLGHNDTAMLTPYNAVVQQFSDDGSFFRGAYGPKFIEQLPYVIEAISKDVFTRQAVISIWRERPGPSKDIPCTLTMQFMYRRNQLDLHVNMRSNDAWLGLPYDIFTFTMLQQYVAMLVGLDPGRYYHTASSLHLYQQHIEPAQRVVAEDVAWQPETQPLTPMPPEFRAMHSGLTLLSKHPEAKLDLLHWLTAAQSMPQPWYDYLLAMAYRFHRLPEFLPRVFAELQGGRLE